MKACHTIRPVFDDPNLVSAAGLVPVLALAEKAGLSRLLASHLSVDCPNAAAKTVAVVAGMMCGADSIDDLDLLRHGGMTRLFSGVRAPSTLGSFLRSFTFGHVQQLDQVSRELLIALARRTPGLIAHSTHATHPDLQPDLQPATPLVLVDVDDTVREVHGYQKQGAAFGYTHTRGLNVMVAAISTATSLPVIAAARLRRGNVSPGQGGPRLLAQAVRTARATGATGPVLCRADAAFYRSDFIAAAVRNHASYSVTVRMDTKVKTTIAGIADDAWTPIHYPKAVWDDQEQRWISDAEVAETPYTGFAKKPQPATARLVVRRVARLGPPPGADGSSQPGLVTAYRYHAFLTNTDPNLLDTVTADRTHRQHAIIEQVIAELKAGPLAHLPSGQHAANAAWVAATVIAFNLARAATTTAGLAAARWATVRTRIVNVPARIASTGRRIILHLPTHWPWAQQWQKLWQQLHTTATGPPATTPS